MKEKKKKEAAQPIQETIEKKQRHEPFGRPTKYKPEFCEKLIEFAESGMSFEAFGGFIGVSRDALYEWVHKHEDFRHAKKIFTSKSQFTLEKMGIDGIVGDNSGFQSTPWIFMMKNRCGWKDKLEVTEKEPVNMTMEEIEAELKKIAMESRE